jgi:putative phosphoesterase
MLLGVISDTHEHLENLEKAKKVLADRGASPVIHLGDYCAGPTVRAMKGMKVIGIVGNNDGDLFSIPRNFGFIGADFRGHFCVLEYDGCKIACYHGTIAEITEALINCGTYDAVFSGHTHHAVIEQRGKVLALNPGSVHGFEEGPTVAVFDTVKREAEIIKL